MCDLCQLQDSTAGFIVIRCRTCGTPLIVARHHRAEFTPEEVSQINELFPGKKRWEMRSEKRHAHLHLEG